MTSFQMTNLICSSVQVTLPIFTRILEHLHLSSLAKYNFCSFLWVKKENLAAIYCCIIAIIIASSWWFKRKIQCDRKFVDLYTYTRAID